VSHVVPEFFDGPSWSSEAARRTWAPRLAAASAAWLEIEWRSAAAGLRDSALLTVPWDEYPTRSAEFADAGLEVTALGSTLASPAYAAGAPTSGSPAIRAAVHRPGLGAEWRSAWRSGDDATIGRLLGFPECCRDFFAHAWAGAGGRDTTPFMATLDGPARANILLRWLGVRLVPHLPCSGNDPMTAALADACAALGRDLGFGEAVAWAEEALAWPMTWSSSHGIGEVVTPALRFRFSSVWTPNLVRRKRVTSVAAAAPPEPAPHHDNGFTTAAGMAAAHRVVLEAALASGFSGGTVLDLGCGDGELLARFVAAAPSATGFGIDQDSRRIARGRTRHPELSLEVERIEDFPAPDGSLWDLVFIMPGRLIEMGARGQELAALLPKVARRVVLYAYGDWIVNEKLEDLAWKAGILVSKESPTFRSPGAEAAAVDLQSLLPV
jgi:hypothetical protein